MGPDCNHMLEIKYSQNWSCFLEQEQRIVTLEQYMNLHENKHVFKWKYIRLLIQNN